MLKYTGDFEKLREFGYTENLNEWYKYVGKRRKIVIWKDDRKCDDLVLDYTTYTGYKYENEYKHYVKHYTQDLIQAGLAEVVEE